MSTSFFYVLIRGDIHYIGCDFDLSTPPNRSIFNGETIMELESKLKDPVRQFLELRENLQNERAALIERVQQIDEVLASTALESNNQLGIKRIKRPRQKRNAMSLKSAVIQITRKCPKTKEEILRELDKMGYIFSSATPINSLNATLYSKGQFVNNNGYFSPVNS